MSHKTSLSAGFFYVANNFTFVEILFKTMKNLIPAIVLGLLFVSCKKDDDKDGNSGSTNKMTYNSIDYNTPNGFLEIYQTDSGDTYIDRDVTFTDLAKTNLSGEISFENKSFAYLDLNNNLETTELEVGTYTFSEERAPMTLVDANFVGNVSYEASNENTTVNEGGFMVDAFAEDLTSGSVTVTKSGSDFVIAYSVNFGEKVISGLYTGSLELVYNENDSTNGIRPNTDFLQVKRVN